MKWFLGLVLVLALVGGALYGVGRFLLPNNLAVTRSVEVNRPRASVYAMVNDLKVAKEWSPYYARDPNADYAFSGSDSGAGQTMRWTSAVRQIGSGRMSIVRADENARVDTILELADRATLSTEMQIAPSVAGSKVDWSVTAECSDGWINVPCRYMNLIMRGMVQKDLDDGLHRLKGLAEQLPNVDFENLHAEIIDAQPQSFVYDTASTSMTQSEVAVSEGICIDNVNRFMTQYALTRAGPKVRVTTAWDPAQQRMSFQVGYPFSGPAPLSRAGVDIGQTPSGRALRVVYKGPRAQLQSIYGAMDAYLQAHRVARRERAFPWEVVRSEGDADDVDMEIFWPLQ